MAIIANLQSMMNASYALTEYVVYPESIETTIDGTFVHVEKRYPGWTDNQTGIDIHINQLLNIRVDCGAGQTPFDTLEAAIAAHAELDALACSVEQYDERRGWVENHDPERA